MYTIHTSTKYLIEDSMGNIEDNKDTGERVLFLQSFQIYKKPESNINCVIKWHVTIMLNENYWNKTGMYITTDVTSNMTFANSINIKI